MSGHEDEFVAEDYVIYLGAVRRSVIRVEMYNTIETSYEKIERYRIFVRAFLIVEDK